ncbi:MAG: stage II sporulation protein P [Clostridiales bacterium]|nr:stage II sporulation protein P [Clostridiales bacterium]
MKFRTVFITKKKIAVFLAAAAVMAGAAAVKMQGQTREVFNISEEDILLEGMPSDIEDGGFLQRIKDMLKPKPPSIAAKYLPDTGTAEPEEEAVILEETAQPEPTKEPEEEVPRLPGREEIQVSQGIKLSNATSYSVNPDAMCGEALGFSVTGEEGPQVLVMHTHTTECYNGDAMSSDSQRNTDETKNVTAVGQVICQTLEGYGISTVHDTTVHDYPTYQGAYTRALKTIEKNLREYPSIKVVLDVHRDAFVYPDGSKLEVSCDINGTSAAQVMLVVGTDAMGLYNPNWRENLKLAAKMQNAAMIMYPGLMRPIDLRTERFNMHMTTGSLLLEVGSNGNTMEQAIEGAKAAGEALAAALLAG